ncbi:MAG: hypothetical protein KKE17_05730, partial [Proteobacteria bacterium]|nr:hypothetical protein [Pseudomonadota bacterium]
MKKILPVIIAIGFLLLGSSSGYAADAVKDLFDWGFNIDGTTYCKEGPCDFDNINNLGELPASINAAGFDFSTGLGTIIITITGEGSHQVIAYFDHDIFEPGSDPDVDDPNNVTGDAVGTVPSGLIWEIDEPGFGSTNLGDRGYPYFGDIFSNFKAGTLDNQVFYDYLDNQYLDVPDDASMAKGWNFALSADETAIITIVVSDISTQAEFYLIQSDPDAVNTKSDIYLAGTLEITSGQPQDIDGDTYTSDVDCDDTDPNVHPNAPEICNDIDDNCNDLVDDGLVNMTFCGVGACAGNWGFESCTNGQWGNNTCDPFDRATPEVCDGRDNNCNGATDEGDRDNDGTADCFDQCPDDSNKTEPGTCGCGVMDTDFDNDGVADCLDLCPDDSNKLEPGTCGCGVADTDSDGDGTPDCNDQCPSDPMKIQPGTCGCGVADTDSDNDGTPDCNDLCPDD